MMVSKLDWIIF